MSRPHIPMGLRIARQIGMPVEYILEVLSSYSPELVESVEGDCWPWRGSMIAQTPIMKHHGKSVPVRRVIEEAWTGQPVGEDVRLSQGCWTPGCVNPLHTLHKVINPPWKPPTEAEMAAIVAGQSDNVEECMDAILSRDRPWDIAALALEWDYDLGMMLEAERQIMEQGL